MLQTWLDASDDFRFFSLAGYVASESNWEEFSTEWKKVLDLGEPPHEPIACFKMSQMDLKYPAHIERCGMLYSVIEKFVDAAISVSVKKEDLFRALDSFKFPKNIRHTGSQKSLLLGILRLDRPIAKAARAAPRNLDSQPAHLSRSPRRESSLHQRVGRIEKEHPLGFPGLVGSAPAFRDDESFMPLQAADMYAFWVRKWESEGDGLQKLHDMNFPWPKTKNIPRLYMRFVNPYITPQLEGMFSG